MTLSTLDTKYNRWIYLQGALRWLLLSLGVVLFSAVYEFFSHGVYSPYMLYAFLFPLAGGAVPALAIALRSKGFFPGEAARSLYQSALATLTVGSLFAGALEIYGTTSPLTCVYWIASGLFLAASLIAVITQRRRFVEENTL